MEVSTAEPDSGVRSQGSPNCLTTPREQDPRHRSVVFSEAVTKFQLLGEPLEVTGVSGPQEHTRLPFLVPVTSSG